MEPLLHIVLDRPKIAGNIGALVRLCAATGSALHVCGPLPFDDGPLPEMRRSGLDYWRFARVHFHQNISRCLELFPLEPWLIEVGGTKSPSEVSLHRGDLVVLGPEDGSISSGLMEQYSKRVLTLPKLDFARSYNMAQCASAVVFEAVRQTGGVVDLRDEILDEVDSPTLCS